MSLLQYASYIFPLLSVPYLTRVIGVANFGSVSFAVALTTYFNVFVNYGFHLTATRQIAINVEDVGRLRTIYSSVLWAKLVLTAGSMLVLVPVAVTAEKGSLLYFFSFAIVLGSTVSMEWFFQGIQNMKYITIIGITTRTVSTALIFIVVQTKADFIYVPLLYGSGPILSGVLGQLLVWKKYKIFIGQFSLKEVCVQLRLGWDFFLSSAFILLYSETNIIVLGMVTSPTITGYYSAAAKTVTVVNSLWGPIPQVLYPHFSKKYASDLKGAIRQLRTVLLLAGTCTFILSLAGFAAAPILVHYYLGDAFRPSVEIVRVSIFNIFAIGVSNILGVQGLLANGQNAAFRNIVLFSGILSILLVAPLAVFYGGVGVAVCSLLIEGTVGLGLWFALRRRGLI